MAVVIATYNRCDTVVRCLELLRQQTRVPEKVYVVDNGSRDGTAGKLREKFGADPMIELIELSENTGNAGGIRVGMEKAFEAGADAVWILDDDAWPRPTALERLLKTYSEDRVSSSLILDPKTEELAWAYVLPGRRLRVVDSIRELPSESVFEIRGAWLGALVPRAIANDVGLPDSELFIRGEDEEYPIRIACCGYRFFCSRESVLEHPAPSDIRRFEVFGRNFFYERGMAPWKAYYVVRNRAYIYRKYADFAITGFVKAWTSVLISVAMAVAVDDQKWNRVKTYLKAGWRGFSGKLGAESKPN